MARILDQNTSQEILSHLAANSFQNGFFFESVEVVAQVIGSCFTAPFQSPPQTLVGLRTVLHQQRQCTANTSWWPTHLVNGFRQTIRHWCSPHEDPVVFVGGLGQAGHGRLLTDSLTVRHNGVRNFDGDPSMVLLQILQADLQMQFTCTSDDVLARLLSDALVAERHTEQVSEHIHSEQSLNLSVL